MLTWIILGLSIVLSACSTSSSKDPAPLLTPGSRLLFHNGNQGLWVVCDRGDRVYMTDKGSVHVLSRGCLDGNP